MRPTLMVGDPEAADELYGSGANVTVIGLDVTQQLMMMKSDLEAMRRAADPHTRFLYDISQFYMAFHRRTVGIDGIYMHDPAAVLLAFRPDLFTRRKAGPAPFCSPRHMMLCKSSNEGSECVG